jgi:hypothetical protein
MVVDHAKVVVDTRNVCHKAGIMNGKVVKA